MSLSRAVGMPNCLVPPPLFGISWRFTGEGWYVPARSSSRMRPQWSHRYGSSSSVVIPSMPGLPLFFLTRFSAAFMLGRDTTGSMSAAPLLPGCPLSLAAVGPSTLRPGDGGAPLPMIGSSSCLDICGLGPSRLTCASPSFTFGPSLPASPAATTTSADFSLRRSSGVALSGVRRDLPRYQRCPSPPGRRIYVALPWPSGLRGFPGRSPCSATPHIRFLFVNRRLRYPLPPHGRSPFRSCGVASFAMACLRDDFHLLNSALAGRTGLGGREQIGRASCRERV